MGWCMEKVWLLAVFQSQAARRSTYSCCGGSEYLRGGSTHASSSVEGLERRGRKRFDILDALEDELEVFDEVDDFVDEDVVEVLVRYEDAERVEEWGERLLGVRAERRRSFIAILDIFEM